jgi:hypothetical protein
VIRGDRRTNSERRRADEGWHEEEELTGRDQREKDKAACRGHRAEEEGGRGSHNPLLRDYRLLHDRSVGDLPVD